MKPLINWGRYRAPPAARHRDHRRHPTPPHLLPACPRLGGQPARQETGLVFTAASGRPIEPSNFRRSFANTCAKAGVRKVHVHATRKTCASLLVALDVPPSVAMQILRHSQIAVTMNIYSEVSSEETRKALKRLGQHLGS
ncbi:tyrosine-type recombinase/integrase [Nonomuraea cavernae]|uniref:Tyr recombinase domain-containing protein n=1 Tax=Nonomuraea cavernae TaxID=2045107 RepID=A0A917YRG2_9ACTN|nr:tyrosine-type recombinase/integrase [Nonomuraea cavernae]MCA2184209.1 tyrosine-type recombinase/integrase [Nonomuraea cavernae]GGO62640.1 hypothetical protein GCM10012289_07780 [Nonomuraea cavernae]